MSVDAETIIRIRSFNRFYTQKLGLLNQHYLGKYSLTEARVLFDINELGNCTAQQLSNRLDIDKSYLSRIIKKFCKEGLVLRTESKEDRRIQVLELSDAGQVVIQSLIDDSNRQLESQLMPLMPFDCEEIKKALDTIEFYFGGFEDYFKKKGGIKLWTLL